MRWGFYAKLCGCQFCKGGNSAHVLIVSPYLGLLWNFMTQSHLIENHKAGRERKARVQKNVELHNRQRLMTDENIIFVITM